MIYTNMCVFCLTISFKALANNHSLRYRMLNKSGEINKKCAGEVVNRLMPVSWGKINTP